MGDGIIQNRDLLSSRGCRVTLLSEVYITTLVAARMASSNHVSLPKPFASGNISEWFTRFDICSDANKWDDDKKVVKLPTLLEGEALAAWLDLSLDDRKEYKTVKEKLTARMAPSNFVTMEEFRDRKLRPGEALSLYLHDLRQLID